MATLGQLLQETYKVLGEPSDSSNYDETTVVVPRINDVVRKICRGKYINPQTQQVYTGGDLPFVRKDFFIQTIIPKSVNTAFTTSSTTISANTGDYATSGYLYIGYDIIQYTNKNPTTFLGVTGINTNHEAGELIYQLYQLPSDISQPFTVYELNKGQRINEYKYQDLRYNTILLPNDVYTIITHNNLQFLHIVNKKKTKLHIIYYHTPSDLIQHTDVCIIPDEWALSVVPPLVAGELLRDTEELDDAISKLNRGCANLQAMYDFYTKGYKKHKEVIHLNPVRMFF